jgi:peptide-methionine (R)-S-oxide reductase
MTYRTEFGAVLVGAFVLTLSVESVNRAQEPSAVQNAESKAATNTDRAGQGTAGAGKKPQDDAAGDKAKAEADDKWVRDPLPKGNAEWRRVLTPQQYNILRRSGTEKAFTGKYWNTKTPGVYRCAGCYQPLFSSATKFDSGTGWPSYWAPYTKDCIGTKVETKFFVKRIEVHCSRCKGHLGHVFNDGPRPTGLRFCLNSPALILDEELPLEAEEAKPED